MLFLLLSITCSVSMALLLKQSESAGRNRLVIITLNYLAGSIVGWLLILFDGGTSFSPQTVLLGLVGGLIWPLPFFILAKTIQTLGVAIAAPLARLGLIVPVSFGILFLGESLSVLGGMGLLSAIAAIFLLSPLRFGELESADKSSFWLIPVMIMMIGIANLWINLFNHYGVPSETNLFFTLIFSFATIFTAIILWRQNVDIKKDAVISGVLIGVPNFFYTYFLLGALRAPLFQNRSAIVYTVLNVAIMLLVFSAGKFVWAEQVTRRNMVGVGIAAVALFLLNIR